MYIYKAILLCCMMLLIFGRWVLEKPIHLPTMEFMLRNATLSFSRRYNYYQLLDKSNTQQPSSSLPPLGNGNGVVLNRQERAKKRQIFLQSYNLSFQSRSSSHDHHHLRGGGEEPLSVKLKKRLVKVKSGIASVLGWNAISACCIRGIGALICVSHPRPISRVTPLSTPSH